VAALGEAEERQRTATMEVRLLTAGQDEAAHDLLLMLDDDSLVTDLLAPALEATLARARELAPMFITIDPDDAELVLDSGPETMAARRELSELRARHDALWQAWRQVVPEPVAGGPVEPRRQYFRYPEHARSADIPQGRLRSLLWLAEDPQGAEPWMPTSSAVEELQASVDEERRSRRQGALAVGM
jgi:hypothetical protein